jgi:hypothetical protein
MIRSEVRMRIVAASELFRVGLGPALLLGLGGGGTSAGSAQERQALPTFPSAVELITVDAVVVDSAGRPVAGLARDDFVVK